MHRSSSRSSFRVSAKTMSLILFASFLLLPLFYLRTDNSGYSSQVRPNWIARIAYDFLLRAGIISTKINLDDPSQYVQADPGLIMSYNLVHQHIQKDEIPLLHQMLNDKKYRPRWPVIAWVIGMVSDDVNSVPLLVDYMKRDDLDYLDSYMTYVKIDLPSSLGLIGGPNAKEILMALVTEEGVLDLVKGWIKSKQVIQCWDNRDEAIVRVRSCALKGLVDLREQDANAIVEQVYASELTGYQASRPSPFWTYSIEAMAMKDYIRVLGLSTLLREMYDGDHIVPKGIGPYIVKYSPELREANEKYKPIKDKSDKARRMLKEE